MSRAGAGRAQVAVAALGIFALALALRLAHLLLLQSSLEGTALFAMTRGDATIHWREAREILGGNPWLADRVPWKGPGYSYFLAGLMALVGPSPAALRWPHAVLGAVNCGLLVLLARRFLSTPWAAAAGLLAACSGTAILYDGELYQPTLLIALSLPALALLTRPDPGPAACAAAGVLLGLGAIVHPAYLFPTLLLCFWAARRSWKQAAAVALGAALTLAPLAGKNLALHGQPVLVSWNGGINLYAANQPNFDAWSGNRTNAWNRVFQTPLDAGIAREHDRDRLYRALAVRQFVEHPLLGSWLLLRKTAAALSPVEYACNIGLYELREHSAVLRASLGRAGPLWWPLGLTGPLMILGAWSWRRRWGARGTVLVLWAAGLVASTVLFFVNARYRLPVTFIGSIWAAAGLEHLTRSAREADRRALARGAAILLAAATGFAALAVPQRGLPLPLEWDQAASLTASGRSAEAEPWIDRALAGAPADAALRHAVAAYWFERGQRDRERAQLQDMLDLPDVEPDLVHLGHHALARSYMLDRRFEEARREIDAALAVRIDAAVWHGHPHFQLGLGPWAECDTRLLAAEIEARAGAPDRARESMDSVRRDCGTGGRFGPKLLDLEVLCVRVAAAPLTP